MYHLRKWILGRQRPEILQELFNLRHASLRNVIERTIDIAKAKFKLPVAMPNGFDYLMQIRLVIAAISVVNFIRHWNICEEQRVHDQDEVFASIELGGLYDPHILDDIDNDEEENDGDVIAHFIRDDQSTSDWSDQIANSMWADYLAQRENINQG